MADSIEQKLVAHAVTSLQAIDGTGDYLTTLALNADGDGNVEDSRPNWDQNELPAISVFTGTVEPEERDDENQRVLRRLPMMIRGALERGTTASDARKFLSDIHRVIREIDGDNWTVSSVRLAEYTQERSHGIEYAPDTFEVTGIQVEIDIFYAASKFNMES